MYIGNQFAKHIADRSPDPTEIRRHRNGSIDLDHYLRVGRAAHGAAVRAGGRSLGRRFGRLLARLAGRGNVGNEMVERAVSREPVSRRIPCLTEKNRET